jgi:hypothetical protein
VYSALLAFAAIGWGLYDLWAGHRFVGAATAVLAAAFVLQFVDGELGAWRVEGAELRSRRLRVPMREIEGVHLSFEGRVARAWLETRGDPVALVEGEEAEVRRIADRLAGTLKLATLPSGRTLN